MILLDADFRELGFLIPAIGHRQLWLPGVIGPLIEELVKGAAGKFFDDAVQILGHHVLKLVAFQIGLDAAAVEFLAELTAQHVQEPASFGIGQEAELIFRGVVIAAHDGVGLVGLVDDALGALIHVVKERVAPLFIAVVEVVVIGGKPLVEPDIRPILARHQIAEPLVGHLMRHQTPAVAQVFKIRGVQRGFV